MRQSLKFFRPCWFGLFAVLSAGAPSSAQNSAELILHCDKMWDGRSDAIQPDTIIVIAGQRIKSIEPGQRISAGSAALDVHGTCMPGMIDVHTHVFLQQDAISPTYDDQLLKQSVAFRTIRAVRSASLALEHGFTTIRDLETEGAGYADVDLRKAIVDGIVPGPTMQVAGRALDVTGAYPLEGYAPEIQTLLPHGVEVVDGAEAARKAVREQISYGVDWIKMYADRSARLEADTVHGIPTFTLEEAKAIVDEAHRERHRVACHARTTEGVELALQSGADTIEHGEYISDQQLSEMKQRGVYYVPTLWDLKHSAERRHNPELEKEFQIAEHTLSRAIKAGVKIAFGTDIGGFEWEITPARQMETLVTAGMTPEQGLLTSIQTGAELMGISDDAGSLVPGHFADIIAVSGDPLKNIGSVEQVQMTVMHGRIYRASKN